jgi:hypothetical protein
MGQGAQQTVYVATLASGYRTQIDAEDGYRTTEEALARCVELLATLPSNAQRVTASFRGRELAQVTADAPQRRCA